MALVLKEIYCGYKRYFHETQDARNDDLLLMSPPWVPFAIFAGYLYFSLHLGPKLMARRKAFDLKGFILVYNAIQVLANLALFISSIKLVIDLRPSLICQPVDYSMKFLGLRELRCVHCYFLLKMLDLVDTVLFVLRKKQNHVSFLHVYHHSFIFIASYMYCRFVPGGHALMLGLWNTFIHAVMYFYFFLTVYRPELTRNANWKKYITMLQMVQFAYLVIHFGLPVLFGYDCNIPKFWLWLPMIQNIFMLLLFSDFYVRAYGKETSKSM